VVLDGGVNRQKVGGVVDYMYLATIWPIASVVISNRYQVKNKPHLYKKWGVVGYTVAL